MTIKMESQDSVYMLEDQSPKYSTVRPTNEPIAMMDKPKAVKTFVPPQPTLLRKLWIIINGAAYLGGGLLFLIGSVLYYPRYYVIAGIPGGGAELGGWMFEIGCVLFVIGTFQDVWEVRESISRQERGSFAVGANTNDYFSIRNSFSEKAPLVPGCGRYVPFLNALLYFIGSLIFLVGAIYFIPKYYAIDPSFGSIAFIIGCILFCIATIWDVIRLSKINPMNPYDSTMQWKNIVQWQTAVAVCTFVGAFLFIIGSYYFLPEFLAEGDDAVIYSVNYFVVGSCFFTLSALISLCLLRRSFSPPAPEPRLSNRLSSIARMPVAA